MNPTGIIAEKKKNISADWKAKIVKIGAVYAIFLILSNLIGYYSSDWTAIKQITDFFIRPN